MRDTRQLVADVALRLAVLLQAGIAPERAWVFVAEATDSTPVMRISRALGAGTPAWRAIADAGVAWAPLALAWRIAHDVGAPLADSLGSFAEGVRDALDSADDVAVAVAEPVGTARLMGWLPLAGLLLGAGLGFEPLAALSHPVGVAAVIGGLVLMATAHAWTAHLVRAATPGAVMPGLSDELCALALSGGLSIERALTLVRGAEADVGLLTTSLPPATSDERERILRLSHAAGVPAGVLLRAEASRARREARIEGRMMAVRLSRNLLLPLGLCTLPAFLLLTIVPLILSVLATATAVDL